MRLILPSGTHLMTAYRAGAKTQNASTRYANGLRIKASNQVTGKG